MEINDKQAMWQEYELAKRRNVIRLLIRYGKHMLRKVEKIATAQGHTNFKKQYMAFLHNIGVNGTTAAELAKVTWVTKQAMSKALKEMEKEGYIRLEPHQRDKRALSIRLSEKGEELIELSRKMSKQMEAEMKEIVGVEAVEQLIETLAILMEHVEQNPEEEEIS
jgi:DNA-binding MarR family transcriptional regulator